MWASITARASTLERVPPHRPRRLLNGYPVGSALEYVNQRYAELSIELRITLRIVSSSPLNRSEFARTWVANNDAQGFVVLGDPAVRLRG